MGKEYTEIDARLQKWLARQRLFFVATAPLAAAGLVNCSPKGHASLVVLGPKSLAYVDIGGSGIETVAHLRENGRIVIMLCAFEGPPKILRFYGTGRVIEWHDEQFPELLAQFPEQPSARNIVVVEVERIRDSCGYGVPLHDFKCDRDSFRNYYKDKSAADLEELRHTHNETSLDGLPGLEFPPGNESG